MSATFDPTSIDAADLPDPILHTMLTTGSTGEYAVLVEGLHALSSADPSFRWSEQPDGSVLLGGHGHIHLDVLLCQLRDTYGANVVDGPRTAVLRAAEVDGQLVQTEPFMRVMIELPEGYIGVVETDLGSKRAEEVKTVTHDGQTVTTAVVPLAQTQDYAATLRAMTDGQAEFSMRLDSYRQLPGHQR